MIRKIDNLGRIVIPKEMRKLLNIKIDDDIKLEVKNNSIVLSKHMTRRKDIEDEIQRLQNLLSDMYE